MKQALLLVSVLIGGVFPRAGAQPSAKPADEKSSLATRTAGLQRRDGFFPYYWDEKKGYILFELSPAALGREFLYFTGLGSGIGSTEAFADRSSFGGGWVCRFRRAGMRVLVIQENTSFRAPNGALELQHSVEYSFPTSVLASLPVEAEQDGTVLVNADALLLRDAFDLLSQLRRPTRAVGGVLVREQSSKATDWRLDKDRSMIDLEHTGSFPLNTEVEALLTFATDSESGLNQPDPHALSVREHHSFVAMPSPGYEPLEQDPRVGFITVSFQDFSRAYDRPLTRYLVNRWRLQKKDPNAALSEPVKPIVFYLDRAIPSRCAQPPAPARCGGMRPLNRRDSRTRCALRTCPRERIRWTFAIPPYSGRTAPAGDGRWGRVMSILAPGRLFTPWCSWIRIA